MSSDSTCRSDGQSAAQQRFLSLFLRSEREVFRYVAALVPNVADAEDSVQQTAVVLWKKFAAYDPSQPFTPWACRFALNKTRQWIERHQRWRTLLENGLAEEPARRREGLRPDLGAKLGRLEGCLGRLPDDQRSLAITTGVPEFPSWPTKRAARSRRPTRPSSALDRRPRPVSKMRRSRKEAGREPCVSFPGL